MKRTVVWTIAGMVLSALAAGCTPKSAPARPVGTPTPKITDASSSEKAVRPTPVRPTDAVPTSPVVARANGRTVTRDELQKPLVDAYGLNILLNLIQLELAEQEADRVGATVTPADVKGEYDLTQAQMFKDADKADYDGLLDQMLGQQHLSRAEFDIVMRTNANLRKVADPLVKDKVTEDNMRDLFNAMYGEKVRVRHIQCSNPVEWNEAKRRVENGESFADVARALSRNARTAALGGELPAFSRQATDLPDQFKNTAFALKPGELSEIVQAGDAYHLIKLEERIAPKAVKYEDMRDALRTQLGDQFVQATVTELRRQLGVLALRTMSIEDPVLRRQWEEKLKKQEATVTDKNALRKQIDQGRKEHEPSGAAPDTPSTGGDLKPVGGAQEVAPAGGTTPAPPGAVSPERPPATQPAP